jgi:polysaccharide pyruvyl transferase WcaK-like protein
MVRGEGRSMTTKAITFFGNFGTRNLGNELTLQAIIENARKYLPQASLNCICSNPQDTAHAYSIPAFPISSRFGGAPTAREKAGARNPVLRMIKRLIVRAPREAADWLRAFWTLKGTGTLVMTGTGMLGDFGIGPLDLHYEILKWAILARLRGCKVLFVSVGVGPLAHPLSRWMVKSALSLAHYRSYRDRFAQQYLEEIGFDASKDRVYPDLVFSLSAADTAVPPGRHHNGDGGLVVGLGLMEYYGQHRSPAEGELIYRRYIERVGRFAAWLLENRHSVSLLIGDLSYDRRVKQDLLGILAATGSTSHLDRIVDQPLTSPEQLRAQLARTDVVIATRFHNVLLALMLGRPVIALSYHEKVRSLMAGVGAADYCQDAEDLDVPKLIEQFKQLEQNAESFSASMKANAVDCRRALDKQYREIFRIAKGLSGPTEVA